MDEGYFELENYGVKLKRLTHDKIEMVRQWRNDPKISKYMRFREYITPEMQEKWFANLDPLKDFYFLIEYKGYEIGVIDMKDIDYENRTGENGIYIYDDSVLCTDVSYRAFLLMCDYMFNVVGLHSTYGHVLNDNSKSIRFCIYLGCERCDTDNPTDSNCSCYSINKDNYFSNKNRIRFIKRWNMCNLNNEII